MYLVEEGEEGDYSVMRVCNCPAGLRRKEYLQEPDDRRPREEDDVPEGKLPF